MINLNKFTKHLYRRKVIGIITNSKGEFLIDQLTTYGKNDWNFPGGGIEKGETDEEALFREL
ncbi:MAG: NUDIX domain-containing protein [Candidatus Woesebacteria bacterium]|nr:NUDIX domain-containing protein [Candidatus Woesebacteria bacterium]